jgi:hypothetical protein
MRAGSIAHPLRRGRSSAALPLLLGEVVGEGIPCRSGGSSAAAREGRLPLRQRKALPPRQGKGRPAAREHSNGQQARKRVVDASDAAFHFCCPGCAAACDHIDVPACRTAARTAGSAIQYPANDPHHCTQHTATYTCPHLTAESNECLNGQIHVARSTQPCNIPSPHDCTHRHTERRSVMWRSHVPESSAES